MPQSYASCGVDARRGYADRVFLEARVAGERVAGGADLVRLGEAGHPTATIVLDQPWDIASTLYLFEVATVLAGAIVGVNPFDEPNVSESKDNTRALLARGGLALEGPAPTAAALQELVAAAEPDDYIAILAFVARTAAAEAALGRMRARVRDRSRRATIGGFSPRYLHSSGQLLKAGPAGGVFVVVIADDREDAEIPGAGYGFAALRAAQALGDVEALERRGKRVLRVHLPGGSLAALEPVFAQALP